MKILLNQISLNEKVESKIPGEHCHKADKVILIRMSDIFAQSKIQRTLYLFSTCKKFRGYSQV